MPDSTIASLHRKYDSKAGFTNSNLSLSLIHFSNLFNTDKYALSNFSTVIFFHFQSSFKKPTKKRHKGGIISKLLDGASLYSFFKSKQILHKICKKLCTITYVFAKVKFTKSRDCNAVLGPFLTFMTGKRSKMKIFNFFFQILLW